MREIHSASAVAISNHAPYKSRGALSLKKSMLHTLVELLGSEPTRKMIAEFGGARIWVPVRSTPEARLTQVLGEVAASALCSRFGGDYLQVPNSTIGNDVHRRIAELHRQGCKINDIALAVGRSRRTVFRLLRKKITDLRLTDLGCEAQRMRRG
ncbi:MAG TPA: helix-turn-helix domain-containing protein [Candidatus Binataceae bacterium]|nr:helix-turn-helix domain-containing protein [Candidatus Binataceae bacterium]